MSQKIEKLRRREAELREELTALRHEIRGERLIEIREQYGVSFLSVVRDLRGDEYQVSDIDTRPLKPGKKPWLMGRPRLKNGTFGKRSLYLYDRWEVVEP